MTFTVHAQQKPELLKKERLHNCAQSQASMHENGVCAKECVKSKVYYVQNMLLKWASEKQEDEKTSIA